MCVIACIDQLRVYSHAIASALNTSLHYIGKAEFICDLAQVTFHAVLVLHHRSAANDFQVRDPRQIRQDLILHAVRKKRVIRIATEVFKS